MTNDPSARRELSIAVTGASGFIGARLVDMLKDMPRSSRLRILSRRRAGAGPGMAFPVDFTDPVSVRTAIAGCHVVAHCAFDFADLDANLAIVRVLAKECAAAGIRIVHVSTAAVYEPFPDGTLDETVSVAHPGSHYKQVKLAIERELVGLVHDAGLDAIILQPTVVYGPHGRAWTDSPIRELLSGTVVLPDGGNGLCNAVYIDDVCRAIIAAIDTSVPAGERLLISGPQPVSWADFYGAYQEMLGLDAIVLQPRDPSASAPESDEPIAAVPSAAARIKRTATRWFGAHAMSQANLTLNFARGLVQSRQHIATGAKRALFEARCEVRIDKARQLIGYEPEFDLARGMRSTQPYVNAKYRRLAGLKKRARTG